MIEEMGIDLAFQVQHGQLLFCKLCADNVRVLQGQVKSQGHQRDPHSADQPGVVQPLEHTDHQFYD